MKRPQAERLVLMPMKDPALAKTRLGPALGPEERAALAKRLFLANLRRLAVARPASRRGFDLAVVTRSATVAALAEAQGALVFREQEATSLSEAVAEAADQAAARGYGSLCVLPSDLAAPTEADLLTLLDHPLGPEAPFDALLCPSEDLGTNALLVPLPRPTDFAYGPRSFEAHALALRAAGLRVRRLTLPSLLRDVDRMEHLLPFPPEAAEFLSFPEIRP